jgi:glutamine synthetase
VLDPKTGLGVESARAECHPGQHEIVLRHRDALAACDDALLQQWVVRDTAARHGVTASYLAAQETGQGSSCHVHLPLSTLEGEPASAATGTVLSQTMLSPGNEPFPGPCAARRACVDGDLGADVEQLRAVVHLAIFAVLAAVGVDDRTAAVRVACSGRSLRLEFRFAGADAQPHLVVAALLAAGCAGIAERLPLPQAGRAVDALANTPWDALSALTGGRVAELLGDEVVAQQAALL